MRIFRDNFKYEVNVQLNIAVIATRVKTINEWKYNFSSV